MRATGPRSRAGTPRGGVTVIGLRRALRGKQAGRPAVRAGGHAAATPRGRARARRTDGLDGADGRNATRRDARHRAGAASLSA